MVELTPEEQIAKDYAACMDSVALINSEKPENTTDEEWNATLERNREHLRIMLAKDFFAGYDITEIERAAQ